MNLNVYIQIVFSLGAKFEECPKALFLLNYLLPEWKSFVDQITTLKKEKFVYSEIIQTVLAKDLRKSASNEKIQAQGLSMTRGRNHNKKSNNRRNQSRLKSKICL